jgi:uncharacterized protein YndB with AHSA1/START domain
LFPLQVTQTLTTSAAPSDVWRAFEAVVRWPQTMRFIREAALDPKGALAPRSRIHTFSESGARRDEHVVEVEPPHRLVLTIDDEDYRARTEYRIAPDEHGSEIVVTGTLVARGIGQSIRFLLWRERMTPMLKTTLRERTQAIVELAERIAAGQ